MAGQSRRHLGAVTDTTGGGPEPHPVTCPDWLAEEARAVWTRLAPDVPPGRLTRHTREAFAQLCVALATYTEADQLITSTGLMVAQGQDVVPNPALAIRDRQSATVATWLKAFGLTPDTPSQPQRGIRRTDLTTTR